MAGLSYKDLSAFFAKRSHNLLMGFSTLTDADSKRRNVQMRKVLHTGRLMCGSSLATPQEIITFIERRLYSIESGGNPTSDSGLKPLSYRDITDRLHQQWCIAAFEENDELRTKICDVIDAANVMCRWELGTPYEIEAIVRRKFDAENLGALYSEDEVMETMPLAPSKKPAKSPTKAITPSGRRFNIYKDHPQIEDDASDLELTHPTTDRQATGNHLSTPAYTASAKNMEDDSNLQPIVEENDNGSPGSFSDASLTFPVLQSDLYEAMEEAVSSLPPDTPSQAVREIQKIFGIGISRADNPRAGETPKTILKEVEHQAVESARRTWQQILDNEGASNNAEVSRYDDLENSDDSDEEYFSAVSSPCPSPKQPTSTLPTSLISTKAL